MTEAIQNYTTELLRKLQKLREEAQHLDPGEAPPANVDIAALSLRFQTWIDNVCKTLEPYQAFDDIRRFQDAGQRRLSPRAQLRMGFEHQRPPSEVALTQEIRAKRGALDVIIKNVEQHPELYADPHQRCRQEIQARDLRIAEIEKRPADAEKIEDLTIRDLLSLLSRLKVSHAWGILLILLSIISGAFGMGYKVSDWTSKKKPVTVEETPSESIIQLHPAGRIIKVPNEALTGTWKWQWSKQGWESVFNIREENSKLIFDGEVWQHKQNEQYARINRYRITKGQAEITNRGLKFRCRVKDLITNETLDWETVDPLKIGLSFTGSFQATYPDHPDWPAGEPWGISLHKSLQ